MFSPFQMALAAITQAFFTDGSGAAAPQMIPSTSRRGHRPCAWIAPQSITDVQLSARRHELALRNTMAFVSALFFAAVTATAQAAQPRELRWNDLVPASAAFDDPFAALSPDHLYLLATVASFRDARAAGGEIDALTIEEAKDALAKLEAEHIDVDGLLARRAEISEKRRQLALSTNSDLEGELIRMPGYVLPLEYDGERVTEFLLVPFVGACIHTPPPPPNQIIHVKVESGFKSTGMFEPVWVDGVIRAEQSSPNLSFVDGSAEIPVAYTLTAEHVEPYQQ